MIFLFSVLIWLFSFFGIFETVVFYYFIFYCFRLEQSFPYFCLILFCFFLVVWWQCWDRKCGRQRRGIRKLFWQLLMVAHTIPNSTTQKHHTTLHCTTQHCTTLHCTTQHCILRLNGRSLYIYHTVLSSVCVHTLSNIFQCYGHQFCYMSIVRSSYGYFVVILCTY